MAYCAEITCHSDAHHDLTVLSSASASGSRRGDCKRELDGSCDDQTRCRALLPRPGIELGVTITPCRRMALPAFFLAAAAPTCGSSLVVSHPLQIQ